MFESSWVWLSHLVNSDTPAYGGGVSFNLIPDKEIVKGDSCNTAILKFPNHLGSHVDAPNHFIQKGISIDEYKPEEWIFTKPLLIDISARASEILTIEHFQTAISNNVADADLVLVRTGIEKRRGEDFFWKSSAGFSADICDYLFNKFQSFSAIGMDTISISSFSHRELGRETHRKFLGAGIRIFEDLSLSQVAEGYVLNRVIALPFRYAKSDGAPTTIVGEIIKQ